MSTILFVDPGTRCSGWALFRDGKYVNSGTVKASRLGLMMDRIDALNLVTLMIDELVIERTPVTSRKPRDFFMPGLAAGLWAAACQMEPVLIRAGDWQRPMLGKRHAKRTSIIRATLEAGRPIEDDNEADAVCIGAYVVSRRSHGKR